MKAKLLMNGSLLATDEVLAGEKAFSFETMEIVETSDDHEVDYQKSLAAFLKLEAGTSREKIGKMDSEFAILLHKDLKVTRSLAARHEFWHYLTVTQGLGYLRKRWGNEQGKVSKERFLGSWGRNCLGRLWWWAELTHDNGDYALTTSGAANQSFMLGVTDNLLGGNRTLLRTLITGVFPPGKQLLSEKQIARSLFPRINTILATINIEALSEGEIKKLTTEVIQQTLEE